MSLFATAPPTTRYAPLNTKNRNICQTVSSSDDDEDEYLQQNRDHGHGVDNSDMINCGFDSGGQKNGGFNNGGLSRTLNMFQGRQGKYTGYNTLSTELAVSDDDDNKENDKDDGDNIPDVDNYNSINNENDDEDRNTVKDYGVDIEGSDSNDRGEFVSYWRHNRPSQTDDSSLENDHAIDSDIDCDEVNRNINHYSDVDHTGYGNNINANKNVGVWGFLLRGSKSNSNRGRGFRVYSPSEENNTTFNINDSPANCNGSNAREQGLLWKFRKRKSPEFAGYPNTPTADNDAREEYVLYDGAEDHIYCYTYDDDSKIDGDYDEEHESNCEENCDKFSLLKSKRELCISNNRGIPLPPASSHSSSMGSPPFNYHSFGNHHALGGNSISNDRNHSLRQPGFSHGWNRQVLNLPIVRPFLLKSNKRYSDHVVRDSTNSAGDPSKNNARNDIDDDDVIDNNHTLRQDRAEVIQSISQGISGTKNDDLVLPSSTTTSYHNNDINHNGNNPTPPNLLLGRLFSHVFHGVNNDARAFNRHNIFGVDYNDSNSNRGDVADKAIIVQFHKHLRKEDWSLATILLESHPNIAQTWHPIQRLYGGRYDGEALPIHAACALHPPSSFIRLLGKYYPKGLLEKEKSFGRCALHVACRSLAEVDVIQILCDMEPQGVDERDTLKRVPLHYLIKNYGSFTDEDDNIYSIGNDMYDGVGCREQENYGRSGNNGNNVDIEDNDGIKCLKILLQTNPQCVRASDHRGWIPLHVACSCSSRKGMTRVIAILIRAWPESILAKTKKGSDVFDCVEMVGLHNPAKKSVIGLLRAAQSKVNNHRSNNSGANDRDEVGGIEENGALGTVDRSSDVRKNKVSDYSRENHCKNTLSQSGNTFPISEQSHSNRSSTSCSSVDSSDSKLDCSINQPTYPERLSKPQSFGIKKDSQAIDLLS